MSKASYIDTTMPAKPNTAYGVSTTYLRVSKTGMPVIVSDRIDGTLLTTIHAGQVHQRQFLKAVPTKWIKRRVNAFVDAVIAKVSKTQAEREAIEPKGVKTA